MDSIQNKNIDCQFQKFILIFPKKMCLQLFLQNFHD